MRSSPPIKLPSCVGDLVDIPSDDPELRAAAQAAHTAGPIAAILDHMDPAGYWAAPGPGYNPKYRSTVWSVITLAQLGAACAAEERIARACDCLVGHALTLGGQFTASGAPSGTADCLQGNLCWALITLGYDLDRLAPAIEWVARSVTGEGVAPRDDRHAAVRYFAGKCGPAFACGSNNGLPCAASGDATRSKPLPFVTNLSDLICKMAQSVHR